MLKFRKPSKRKKKEVVTITKPVPPRWEDFVQLIDIKSPEGRGAYVPFVPFEYQRLLDKLLERHVVTLIIKSRQMGITQQGASKKLHNAIKHEGYTGLFLSKNQDDTSLIAMRIREMAVQLARKGYCELANDNLKTISFKNGGTLHFKNSKPDAARGIPSVDSIFFDEVAFVEAIAQIYDAVEPTTSMLGDKARIVIASTPNGLGNWYSEKVFADNPESINLERLLEQIRQGKIDPTQYWVDQAGWAKIAIHWRAHPIYGKNPNFLIDKARERKLPLEQVKQEYDLSFSDSTEVVFSNKLIEKSCTLEKFKWGRKTKCRYHMGIDCSTTGNDFFVVPILEESLREQKTRLVAMYRARKQTMEHHISNIFQLLDEYRPIVNIEITGGVGQLYAEAIALKYPFLEINEINTTQTSKGRLISRLILLLESENLALVNLEEIKQEMFSFRKTNKQYGALPGKHDDIIMSLCFGSSTVPIYEKASSGLLSLLSKKYKAS